MPIVNTRIVGLIAVVCAAIVAPQALAMPIIDSENATPAIITPPADGIQGNDLSGFALSDPTHSPWQSPLGQPANNTPGGIDLSDLKNGRAVFTAATPDAGQGYDLSGLDLSVLNGIRGYEKQDQYLKGLALAALAGSTEKSVKSVQAAMFVYMPTNPGWGAAATTAKKSAATLAVKTAPGWVCNGQAEYEYVYAGCE